MIYDYKVLKSGGEELNLADYKGKVIMIVNTATGWGFTPQYAQFEPMINIEKVEECIKTLL